MGNPLRLPHNCIIKLYYKAFLIFSRAIISRLTESACKHFDGLTLFKKDWDAFCEIENSQDKVVMREAVFRMSGNRNHGVVKAQTGELIETDKGMKLIVKGKFVTFISQDEFANIFYDEDKDFHIV